MPARIRLQRFGRKGRPFYHIVIADGRAPRDGKFIETIGTYNPITNPAEIKLDTDKALQWLQNGAQPSDTVRAILTYKGVMYKNHLLKGVAKGALTLEQAEAKFQVWLKEKEAKIENKAKNYELSKKEEMKKRLDAEKKVNEERSEAIAKKKAEELAAKEAEIKAKADAKAKALAEEQAKAEPETRMPEEKPEEKSAEKAE
ncbi:MAG: 30S ribosomal protein S16 [Bacteroidales bacterium]|nr:30S ribosomal protein S16 [Bacteroidales bacterium]